MRGNGVVESVMLSLQCCVLLQYCNGSRSSVRSVTRGVLNDVEDRDLPRLFESGTDGAWCLCPTARDMAFLMTSVLALA